MNSKYNKLEKRSVGDVLILLQTVFFTITAGGNVDSSRVGLSLTSESENLIWSLEKYVESFVMNFICDININYQWIKGSSLSIFDIKYHKIQIWCSEAFPNRFL